jgi:hypothetical protein
MVFLLQSCNFVLILTFSKSDTMKFSPIQPAEPGNLPWVESPSGSNRPIREPFLDLFFASEFKVRLKRTDVWGYRIASSVFPAGSFENSWIRSIVKSSHGRCILAFKHFSTKKCPLANPNIYTYAAALSRATRLLSEYPGVLVRTTREASSF